ncbi:alkaline phosphatase family protein [Paraburkholderia rhizosphaerae]|uniref:Phosphoesterase family protein n=1 Tax=Paraburkholderia rhizosphaerae TaxID=480658 RepID=A0A4R8LX41_9BURK|nr:alkaline phosphatase family protein [Paraburkholderia rhizosphaerae]TDY52232.1 phosphoesterase family protein [Paraburkholderia rhizosphaerae]
MSPRFKAAPPKLRATAVSASTLFVMAVAPALLAACGGGSDGGTNVSHAVATQKVQGKMAAQYPNVTVCSDDNNNGACDSNEATTTTDGHGNFTLTTTATNLPVAAVIPANTAFIDPATGAAKTTAKAMVLRAPAAANQMLSPLSTEVVREMAESNIDEKTAVANIAGRLGVAAADVLADPSTITDATKKQALATETTILTNRFELASTMVARGDVSPTTGKPVTIAEAEQTAFNLEGVPRFDNLFVIILENHTNSAIDGSPFAPKITALLDQGNRATNYYSTGQPSQPNYMALGAADDFGVTDDSSWWCMPTGDTRDAPTDGIPAGQSPCNKSTVHNIKNARNMFTTLRNASLTWRVYNESMTPGQDARVNSSSDSTQIAADNNDPTIMLPRPGSLYALKHNNAVTFDDVRNDGEFQKEIRTMGGGQWDTAAAATAPAGCNFDQLGTDLQTGDVGNLNYLIPDQCDDMHSVTPKDVTGTKTATDCSGGNASITRGDNYTAALVQKIQSSPLWANRNKKVGIVIMFDEGNGNFQGTASCCGWNAAGTAVNAQVGEPATLTQPVAGYSAGNQGNGPVIFGVLTNQQNAPTGLKDADQYSHFSFVRTMQDMFGLSDPAVPTSYMNRSKYTQSFIAANLVSLPEFQGSIDPHYDSVRPMSSVFTLKK